MWLIDIFREWSKKKSGRNKRQPFTYEAVLLALEKAGGMRIELELREELGYYEVSPVCDHVVARLASRGHIKIVSHFVAGESMVSRALQITDCGRTTLDTEHMRNYRCKSN